MTGATSEATSAKSQADAARSELLATFNEWYQLNFDEPMEATRAPVREAQETQPRAAEVMDDDEQFEQLQMQRVMAEAPESLPFMRARKAAVDHQRLKRK